MLVPVRASPVPSLARGAENSFKLFWSQEAFHEAARARPSLRGLFSDEGAAVAACAQRPDFRQPLWRHHGRRAQRAEAVRKAAFAIAGQEAASKLPAAREDVLLLGRRLSRPRPLRAGGHHHRRRQHQSRRLGP